MYFNPAKRLTRITACVVALFVIMTLWVPTNSSYAATFGDLTYDVSGGKITITGYKGSSGEAVIPKEIDGKPVTAIEDSAFEDDTKIKSIVIPETITSIGNTAFWGAENLKSYTFQGATLPEFGMVVFDGVSDATFYCKAELISDLKDAVEEGLGNISSCKFEVLVEKEPEPEKPDPTPASSFDYEDNSDGGITITEFTGSEKVVIIPDTIDSKPVTEIYSGDFSGAFNSCDITSITIPKTVTYIGPNTFAYCYDLAKVRFEHDKSAPIIEYGAFDQIGDDVAGGAVFYCHIDLKTKFRSLLDEYLTYHDATLETWGTATPPEPDPEDPEITPVTAFAFTLNSDGDGYVLSKYNGGFKKIGIPEEYNNKPIVEIGAEAFSGYKAIESVKMSDNIIAIGKSAFYDCQKIKDFELSKNLISIAQSSFQRCNSVTEFNIPASVEEIGWQAFAYCKTLKNIKVNAGNDVFTDIDGVLYSKDKKTLVTYPTVARDVAHYEIPDGTITIQEDAFRTHYADASDSKLLTVGYPSTLKKIEDRAFWQTNLESVTISSEIEFGDRVFELCKNLKTVNIAEGVKVLKRGMFYGVDNLEVFNLPTSLETIEDEALQRYPLSSVNLPEGLKSIGTDAFANSKLTSVKIPASVIKVGDRAFNGISTLKNVEFAAGSKLETLNQYSFSQNPTLEAINLPDSLKTISNGAFGSCYNLKSIDIPDNVTTMGNRVFALSGIEAINLSNNLQQIGNNTFEGCPIKSIEFPATLEKWGEYTFKYCQKLENVTFPENTKLKIIPTGTFIDCFKLRKIELPESIDETDITAFLNVNMEVEHKASVMKRNPLDCINLTMKDESCYDLGEDGYYYTTRDLWFGETLIEAGYKLIPQLGVTFKYVGYAEIIPELKSVNVPENSKVEKNDEKVKINVIANGIKAGSKIHIKAVGKESADTVTATGILSMAKGENKGSFASVKTLIFDNTKLSEDEYEILASLDGQNDWIKSTNTVVLEKEKEEPNKPDPGNPNVPTVSAVNTFRVTAKDYSNINLSWTKNNDVTGYEIYIAKSKGAFKKLVTVNNSTTKYTAKNLDPNTSYRFKIRAYTKIEGKIYYSDYSGIKEVKTKTVKVNTARKFKATEKKRSVKLSWSRDKDAKGYVIYMAKTKNGKYKKIKTIKSNKTTAYTKKKLKRGKTYYFKIKEYKVVKGKTYYSKASKAIKAKAK